MRYLIPTSDHPYYLWQVLVQAEAFRELGEHAVWLIYHGPEPSPLLQAMIGADIGEFYLLADWPRDGSYNCAMKDWMAAKYLAEHPEPGPFALYDPDAIPTRKLALVPEPGVLYGSDTDSYTGPAYLKEKGAWEGLCDLVGVDPQLAGQYTGVGAQYVWDGMAASFWEEVAHLSIQAFSWLNTVPAPEGSNSVQAWCADMFVTQLLAIREGWEPRIAPELSMVWADGPSSGWETDGVFHDAGVPHPMPGHFCKLSYQQSPFFTPIEYVSPASASARYVELIRATEQTWPDLCRVFADSGSTIAAQATPTAHDPLDYVRTSTPDMALLWADGSPVMLSELTRERAVLLLLASARDTTLALLPQWRSRLPLVHVIPVVREPIYGVVPQGDRDGVLLDPDSRLASLFGATDAAATAVLLGTDGLLAGGPVSGTDAIAGFVADIVAALSDE